MGSGHGPWVRLIGSEKNLQRNTMRCTVYFCISCLIVATSFIIFCPIVFPHRVDFNETAELAFC